MEMAVPEIWDDRYGHPGTFSVLGCPRCGQLVTVPPMTEAELPELYSRYYPRRDIDLLALSQEAARVTAPIAALKRWWDGTDNQGHYLAKPGQLVLDIGSGSCLSLIELRNIGVEAWGVETDPNVRAIADHFDLRVHIGSIHDEPFPSMKFGLITLSQVIEHIPDPKAMLRAIHARLEDGGTAILSFPNAASIYRRIFGIRWLNWHIPFHLHFYNLKSFRLIAEAEGFDLVSSRSITPNLWTALQLRGLRRPARGIATSTWGAVSGNRENALGPLAPSILSRLARRLLRLVLPAIAVVNRLVDATGAGDSLMVVLRKGQPR